jgi:ubiquitin-like modifier-activating enzyme ATG7
MASVLKFEPLSSHVDSTFWKALADKKLNLLKSNDDQIELSASIKQKSLFVISSDSFNINNFSCKGVLKNTNTIEHFKSINKEEFLHDISSKIYNSIVDGSAIKNPALLTQFGLLTFADIKQYK